MVSAVAPPNVAGTLATVISQTSCANKLPLRPGVLAQTRPPPASLMHVEIGGLRNKKGQVVCDGYSSGDGFPKNGDKALVHAKSPISKRTAACDFPDSQSRPLCCVRSPWRKLRRQIGHKLYGLPREGVGASNNAKGHFGPPKFDAAAFVSQVAAWN